MDSMHTKHPDGLSLCQALFAPACTCQVTEPTHGSRGRAQTRQPRLPSPTHSTGAQGHQLHTPPLPPRNPTLTEMLVQNLSQSLLPGPALSPGCCAPTAKNTFWDNRVSELWPARRVSRCHSIPWARQTFNTTNEEKWTISIA